MRTHYQERMALGARVQLALVTQADSDIEPLLRQLWLEIMLFEKRCSRFLPASELSLFNRAAGVRQQITPEFRDVLLAAQRMSNVTEGLYNPFVLPALQRAGYDHSLLPGHETDQSDDHSTKRVIAASGLEIGDTWASIPYGTAIDLGGCGKGYIGDVLAAIAQKDERLQGFWFAIGGDVVTYGKDEQGKPWTIYLQPDPKGAERIGEVIATSQDILAVATSTTRYRKGTANGKAWHHIIDPRSGKTAQSDVSLATICSSSLLVADVMATCLIIVGTLGLRQLLADNKITNAAWLVDGTPRLQSMGETIRVYTHGRMGDKPV